LLFVLIGLLCKFTKLNCNNKSMKIIKLALIALSLIIFFGCSTSSDSNGNSPTTIVPVPPTNLITAVFSTTQINLSWTDNSTNETGFKIERKTKTGNYAIVGTVAADALTFSDTSLTPSTTYIYRVYSYNSAGNSSTYSNEASLTTGSPIALPTLTTSIVSAITQTTASSGGSISNDGGAPVTDRGIVWSTSSNPTIALTTKTNDGISLGTFTSAIKGLTGNTTFYVRAYATNSIGTNYGNEVSFTTTNPQANIATDIDGNSYDLVTICNQTWLKSNLNVTKYRNGDEIPQVSDAAHWSVLTTGAWCYYAYTSVNGTTFGKLYNWYAVNDPRGLAPAGYHIPSDAEWTTLANCLGGETVAGGKMKETGITNWKSPNTDATNSSGFTGLPGGYNGRLGSPCTGNSFGHWWSSTEDNTLEAWYRPLYYNDGTLYRGNTTVAHKSYGFSVRCVKD
jgi:uncharacterized protein (TIGR02145 family)